MQRSASALLGSVLGVLFPIRCAGCGRRGANACETCWPLIPWIGSDVCPLCALPTRQGGFCRPCGEARLALDGSRAACRFEGLARTAIHDLKFRGVRRRAELLGQLAAEAVERRPMAIDFLVPIPLSVGRLRERGFNQSELISIEIGGRIGVPVLPSCLERARETPPQVRRTRAERQENVAGAFRLRDGAPVAGRRIALIDDVMTTGATLSAAAEALKASGAARVYAVVVAREV
jgi:ComF family protein